VERKREKRRKKMLGQKFKRKIIIVVGIVVLGVVGGGMFFRFGKDNIESVGSGKIIKLPRPRAESETCLEEAIYKRRSVREYKDKSLALFEVAQLVWAAQGVTNKDGLRSAPSAGALYPLEVYVMVGKVEGLAKGVYRYEPSEHELVRVRKGDYQVDLYNACLGQAWVKEAGMVLIFGAEFGRTTAKYGERGERYVHMEVGHAAENVYLQAVALNLGTVVVGAFDDEAVADILQMPKKEEPLYVMPVGKK